MSDVKDRVADAASTVADKAKDAAHAVACGASRAVDYVKGATGVGCSANGKDFGALAIKEGMDVIGCCGGKVGVVDHVEGSAIKLTKKDSPDGQHHFLPTAWVERVDEHVHLTKNAAEAKDGWRGSATACGCS